jgi:hypothetical protein
MNMKSCDACGVVVDLDKIRWPKRGGDGFGVDSSIERWDHETGEHRLYVRCCVCSIGIFFKPGDQRIPGTGGQNSDDHKAYGAPLEAIPARAPAW